MIDTTIPEAVTVVPEVASAGAAPLAADDLASAEREAAQAAAAELEAGGSATHPSPGSTRLLADLASAMRVAALAAHQSSVEQLRLDAATAVEWIHNQATLHAATARERSDADVAGVREWSKLELARIKAETEERIDVRRRVLEEELAALAGSQATAVEAVGVTAAAFEAELAAYFEHLVLEEEPSRIAALAGELPASPVFPSWPPEPSSGWSFSAAHGQDGTGLPTR